MNISNTIRCFDGSYEEERLQQLQDTSHSHMKKETLEREDRLPTFIPCDPFLLHKDEATFAA